MQKNSWNLFFTKNQIFFGKNRFHEFFCTFFTDFRVLCLRRNSIAAVAENWYQLDRIDICYLWSHKNSEKKIDKFVVTVIIGKLWIISIKCRKKMQTWRFFYFLYHTVKLIPKILSCWKNTIHAEIFIDFTEKLFSWNQISFQSV